jgi:hypothetical protein
MMDKTLTFRTKAIIAHCTGASISCWISAKEFSLMDIKCRDWS